MQLRNIGINSLSRQIAEGNVVSLGLVKSLATSPALINEDTQQLVVLEVESHSQNASAEVCESLVISTGTGTKTAMADNVAPGPWSWELSGYIKGLEGVDITSYFTPSRAYYVSLLKNFFMRGMRCTYRDIDCQYYDNVVIENLSISYDAQAANVTPFTMTLKQINVMEGTTSEFTNTEMNSIPAETSELSDGTNNGTTSATMVSTLKVTTDNLGITYSGSGVKK